MATIKVCDFCGAKFDDVYAEVSVDAHLIFGTDVSTSRITHAVYEICIDCTDEVSIYLNDMAKKEAK